MLRAVIVEDKEPVAKDFQSQLVKYASNEIEIVGIAHKFDDALAIIKSKKPDVLFLDIELDNGKTSFDLLSHLDTNTFEVVFFTDHSEYAIRAMRVSALDYLVKPVISSELIDAIRRLEEKKKKKNYLEQVDAFQQAYKNPQSQQNKIALPTSSGLTFASISDIIYCESDNNYTHFYLTESHLLISQTLKEFEKLLTPCDFCRIHNSYLINLRHLKRYIKGEGGQVEMSNKACLDVSKTYKAPFIEKVKKRSF